VKKLLVPILIAIVAIAVGLAIGVFFIGPKMAPKAEEKPKETTKDESVLYDMPKMTINLSDYSWIVQIKLTLRFKDQKTLDEITTKDPDMAVIKDIIISVISRKKPGDFTSEGMDQIMNEIKEAINDFYGKTVVLDVFYTEKLVTKLPM
jgi:flagellar basal body-associated protein FliL